MTKYTSFLRFRMRFCSFTLSTQSEYSQPHLVEFCGFDVQHFNQSQRHCGKGRLELLDLPRDAVGAQTLGGSDPGGLRPWGLGGLGAMVRLGDDLN